MGFIIGVDITIFGVTLLWHGVLEESFRLFFTGLGILLFGDAILMLYDFFYRGKDGRRK